MAFLWLMHKKPMHVQSLVVTTTYMYMYMRITYDMDSHDMDYLFKVLHTSSNPRHDINLLTSSFPHQYCKHVHVFVAQAMCFSECDSVFTVFAFACQSLTCTMYIASPHTLLMSFSPGMKDFTRKTCIKDVFVAVSKEAWVDTVKMSVIINSFCGSGT